MASNLNNLLLVISTFLLLLLSSTQGQEIPPCASNLIGCADYLNSTTTPPATCCGPLKAAALNQTACLCNLLNNKDLLKTFNVDPAQGLALAKRCSVSVDSASCAKASAPSSSTGGATTTPASSNSTTAGKTTNSAQKASWTAVNGLMILLFPLLGLITV